MIKALTSNWHMGRIFRAVTGLAALIFAFLKQDSVMGLAGGLLLLMGLADAGCGNRGCRLPGKTATNTSSTEVEFTEEKK